MAGDAAHQTESGQDAGIISEATAQLRKMFGETTVPAPREVIITRWGQDRFAKGSYSYLAPRAQPEDYDLMAKPVGNLHFAGEANCGTHPATVHGAYLSGLRAASEVIESLLGPIHVPTPLISPKAAAENRPSMLWRRRKPVESESYRVAAMQEARRNAYEAEINMAVHERLGERPSKPGKSGANPFLLYQKDHWQMCKRQCDEARQRASRSADAKATRNEVRAALGQMWRQAPADEKQPYLDLTASNKQSNVARVASFNDSLAEWDRGAATIRKEYLDSHPLPPDGSNRRENEGATMSESPVRAPGAYVEDDDDGMDLA